MSSSVILAVLWTLAAALALLPPRASALATLALIVAGVPIAGLLTYQHGPWPGIAALGFGICALRWRVGRTARLADAGE